MKMTIQNNKVVYREYERLSDLVDQTFECKDGEWDFSLVNIEGVLTYIDRWLRD